MPGVGVVTTLDGLQARSFVVDLHIGLYSVEIKAATRRTIPTPAFVGKGATVADALADLARQIESHEAALTP